MSDCFHDISLKSISFGSFLPSIIIITIPHIIKEAAIIIFPLNFSSIIDSKKSPSIPAGIVEIKIFTYRESFSFLKISLNKREEKYIHKAIVVPK